MKEAYTCVSYIRGADGTLIEFSALSDGQKQGVRETIAENVGRTLSRFLSDHPEEIEPLSRCQGVSLIPES